MVRPAESDVMRILFWGTPDFGVPSLRALQEEGHAVVAVVTQPDRPAGRGRTVRPGPIKRIARDSRVPVIENKPLARSLHSQVEIGETVPESLFQAVAEVLAYVYRLKKS